MKPYYIIKLKPTLEMVGEAMPKADALKWMEDKAKANPKGPSCTALSPDKTLLEYNDGENCYKFAAVSVKRALEVREQILKIRGA
jgi:hypothetical protein